MSSPQDLRNIGLKATLPAVADHALYLYVDCLKDDCPNRKTATP